MQMEAVKLAFADALHHCRPGVPTHPGAAASKEYARSRAALITGRGKGLRPRFAAQGRHGVFLLRGRAGNSISMIQSLYQGLRRDHPRHGHLPAGPRRVLSMQPGHANEAAPCANTPYHTIIPGFLTATGSRSAPFPGIMGGYMQPQAARR